MKLTSLKIDQQRLRRVQTGFSLIELMVAMFLGIIVSAGIITLFTSTSRANRVQAQLAHMQEQGRFAVSRFIDDLRMGNAQYCSNSGGVPTNTGSSVAPIVLQDQIYSPQVFVQSLNLPLNTVNLAVAPTAPYPMPSSYYMRGYDCDNSSCSPTAPTAADGIPAMGTSVGDRMQGTDILTVRYLRGTGWSLDAGYSTQAPTGASTSGSISLVSITLAPSASTEPPASHFQAGDVAMLAQCTGSQIFAVTKSGNVLTPNTTLNFNTPGVAVPSLASRASTNDPRLYDFSRDFVTATYFLELKADDNPDASANRKVGVLMRKINNDPAQELVRGVERLDFRYAVSNANGGVAYLTADQVDNSAGGALTCPAGAKGIPAGMLVGSGGQLPGCMWRAVKTIEVNMLLNSVDHSNMTGGELAYSYPPDGSSTQLPPNSPTNGLARNMMRRSFTALVSVRNGNF